MTASKEVVWVDLVLDLLEPVQGVGVMEALPLAWSFDEVGVVDVRGPWAHGLFDGGYAGRDGVGGRGVWCDADGEHEVGGVEMSDRSCVRRASCDGSAEVAQLH